MRLCVYVYMYNILHLTVYSLFLQFPDLKIIILFNSLYFRKKQI